MTKEVFRERFGDEPRRDDLTMLAPRQDDPTEQVYLCFTCPLAVSSNHYSFVNRTHTQIFVFFPDDEKVGVKTIKTYAERMRNENVLRGIMVTMSTITPFARQCLQEMASKYYLETVSMAVDSLHRSKLYGKQTIHP